MLEFDVAILGGGFAGVYCAKSLSGYARRHGLKVCLVSDENYFVFQPMLPEVAAGSISPRHVVNPVRQMCRGLAVFKGSIRSLDGSSRTLHVNAGDFTPDVAIRARHLVLALGAEVDLSRVPGMPEHCLLMQNVGDAMRLRSTVISRFEEANLVSDPALRRPMLTFVVVGGGYSGVETAGEIHDLMVDIQPYYDRVGRDDFRVVLVHSQDHLLPTLASSLGDYAQRKLQARGLQILLNTRVKAVTARSAILDDGRAIEAHTIISTVGNGPHSVIVALAKQLGLQTERGRVVTDPHLRVRGSDWLWAAGDNAAIPYVKGGYCPATAQFAQRQGELLGRNLAASLQNRPLKPFTFKSLGELAAIGHRTAVAEILGFRFSGFLAWWMWRTIYIGKLPGLQRKLRVMLDWTFDLFFPRDINLLNPRYSKPLKTSYLEKGDLLFNPGEPAFSLYFVRTGAIELVDTHGDTVITIRGGGYFGERALLSDRKWRYAARAAEPTYLVALGAPEFYAMLEGSTALRKLFRRSAQAYLTPEEAHQLKDRIGRHLDGRTAADVMNREVDALRHDMPLPEALELIRQRRHGSYPVVDSAGRVLGVLKRDDLFDSLKQGLVDATHHVKELPLDQLPLISPTDPSDKLLEIFVRQGRNKLLVVDADQRLLGLVTLLDLVEEGVPATALS